MIWVDWYDYKDTYSNVQYYTIFWWQISLPDWSTKLQNGTLVIANYNIQLLVVTIITSKKIILLVCAMALWLVLGKTFWVWVWLVADGLYLLIYQLSFIQIISIHILIISKTTQLTLLTNHLVAVIGSFISASSVGLGFLHCSMDDGTLTNEYLSL